MSGFVDGILKKASGGGGGATAAASGLAGLSPASAALDAAKMMTETGDMKSQTRVKARTGGNRSQSKQHFRGTNFGADNSQIKLYLIAGFLVAAYIVAKRKKLI